MLFHSSQINAAAAYLKAGKVVAFPTETVYGLGAPVFNPEAIRKIFEAKGRPSDNPLIVHISHFSQLELVVRELPKDFHRLVAAFFPGPLTIILPKKEKVPDLVSAGLDTIGVRMPAHPLARALIEAVGEPLVAPSANISGKPSSTTALHVLDDFGKAIGGVLDGGSCSIGIESTVITLDPFPRILRPGAVTQKQLEQVLGFSISNEPMHSDKPLCPGMKYRHYAPNAHLKLFFSQTELREYLKSAVSLSRLVIDTVKAEELYAILRQADKECLKEVVIYCDDAMQADAGLMNRLLRASESTWSICMD